MKLPSAVLLCLVTRAIAEASHSSTTGSSSVHEPSSTHPASASDSSMSVSELGPLSPLSPSRRSGSSGHDSSSDDCSGPGAQAKASCQKSAAHGSHSTSTSSASSAQPSSTPQSKCETNGATMCNSSSKASYFQCVKSAWQQMTCTAGTECRTVNNKAVCADPNAPVESSTSTETKVACDTNNSTMCDASDKSAFYMCTDKFWTKMQCDGANVCMARDGKTACVDQATADAPVLPCTVANATQCAPDNQKIFQICIDDYWTNSTCADDNYCLLRGDSAVCVDKATANAPVLPCTTAKATRCIDGAPQKYQFCYDGYWSNSTCTDNNYCLFRGESALCVDKATAEAPVQPCTKANATRCVDEDELIYQLCYDGFWSNSTCDTGNVCRMPDTGKNAVCMDKDEAYLSITMSTLHEPTPFRGTISMGVSVRDALSWGPSVVLGALAIAFGVGI